MQSFRLEFFSGKFGEIWAKILRTPKNLPAPTPLDKIMLKNCDNHFKFGQFRQIKCTATNNHRIDQINNKPQDLLVNTSGATSRAARNFIRAGENDNRVSACEYFNAPCF